MHAYICITVRFAPDLTSVHLLRVVCFYILVLNRVRCADRLGVHLFIPAPRSGQEFSKRELKRYRNQHILVPQQPLMHPKRQWFDSQSRHDLHPGLA